jgi:hypothetical protein
MARILRRAGGKPSSGISIRNMTGCIKKMRALLELYCSGLSGSAQALHAPGSTECWAGNSGSIREDASTGSGQAWNQFLLHQSMLLQHANIWAQKLSGNNLALNLLDFSRKVGRIAPFEI